LKAAAPLLAQEIDSRPGLFIELHALADHCPSPFQMLATSKRDALVMVYPNARSPGDAT
jgi:hypothetical protein